MLLCGQKYKYAALQNGRYCLCGNTVPTSGKTNESECPSRCNGHQNWPSVPNWMTCGGASTKSIYNVSERITGLLMMRHRRLAILEPVKIFASLVNGQSVSFTFNFGDDTTSRQLSIPEARHIYDKPGSYIITVRANNVLSGFVSASTVYDVDEPASGVSLVCPQAVEVGHILECNGTIFHGSRVNITVTFGNGRHIPLMLSKNFLICLYNLTDIMNHVAQFKI